MRSEAVKNNSARTNIQLVEGSAGWLECGSGGPGGLQTPGHISFVDPNRYTQKSDESLEKDLRGPATGDTTPYTGLSFRAYIEPENRAPTVSPKQALYLHFL